MTHAIYTWWTLKPNNSDVKHKNTLSCLDQYTIQHLVNKYTGGECPHPHKWRGVPNWNADDCLHPLTHWGRVTHICVSKLTIIGSDNGLLPGRRQAIIWTNAGILFIRTLGTNFSEIWSEIRAFSFKKMDLKMSSAKWRRFSLGLNVLNWSESKMVFVFTLVDKPDFNSWLQHQSEGNQFVK